MVAVLYNRIAMLLGHVRASINLSFLIEVATARIARNLYVLAEQVGLIEVFRTESGFGPCHAKVLW